MSYTYTTGGTTFAGPYGSPATPVVGPPTATPPPTVISTFTLVITSTPSEIPSAAPPSAVAAKTKTKVGPIVGASIGGLVAGAVVVAALFFLLFRRRRRNKSLASTANDGMVYSSSPWQEDKNKLMMQLNDAQAERAQLRTYLQVADTRDPSDVVDLFEKLNVSIKNSCLFASAAILKSVQIKSSWTTKDAKNLRQVQRDLGGARALAASERGAGRKPEEFLPHAFRYIVNLKLVENLFGLFHPEVSKEENKLLLDMYRDIRHRDPQRLSARWRCSTYSAIDSRIPPSSEWSNHFADDVLRDVSSIVSSLFNEVPAASFSSKFRGELVSIGTEAYKWNRTTKSTFNALDFRPVLFTSADPFDPASMALYLSHKPEEQPPRKIVSAVTLALMSIASVSVGDEIREESVWQTKAEVLTEGFF